MFFFVLLLVPLLFLLADTEAVDSTFVAYIVELHFWTSLLGIVLVLPVRLRLLLFLLLQIELLERLDEELADLDEHLGP